MVAIPKSAQISNFISAAKRKNFGAVGEVSLQTLQLSVEKFRNVPANIDEAYVLGASFNITHLEEGSFAIVWSTGRLSRHDMSEVVHADCTYKCTWNNYPVTIMGFSDKNRTFHPTIVAVSSRETHREFEFMFRTWKSVNPGLFFKYLLADAAEAVYNAAVLVWPGLVRLMCYAHVYMVSSSLN